MPGIGIGRSPVFKSRSVAPSPPAIEKYYDFQIRNADLSVQDVPVGNDAMPAMDGVGFVSYDYLSLGSEQLCWIRGWTGVSVKTIFTSVDKGLSVQQQADFPGAIGHVFTLIKTSNGRLRMYGGDDNGGSNPNEMWEYVPSGTPNVVGTWTLIAADMGSIWKGTAIGGSTRIMTNGVKLNDGYVYFVCGQGDNSASIIHKDVIRVHETSTTFEFVFDLTAFMAANSIDALSNAAIATNGTDILIAGGMKYTGAFVTNTYNNKVIKGSSGGTVWTVQSTNATLATGYCNGKWWKNKFWVLNGVTTSNLKGIYYSSDLGVTFTENYDAPSARHASGIDDSDDGKLYVGSGNLHSDCFAIEEKTYPYEVADDLKNTWWLFLPQKPTATAQIAYNNLVANLTADGLWSKIKYMYLTPGLTTSGQRKYAFKRNKKLTGPDDQDYKTPYLASDTGVQVITDGGNPEHITIKSIGGYNSGTYISTNFRFDRDNDGLTVDNNALFVFTFSQGDEGVDGGIFSGPAGQLIIANDINFGAGGFVGGLFTNYAIGTAPSNSIGLRGVMKFDSSNNIKMVANSSVQTVLTGGTNTDLIDSIERLCAVNQRSNREQTFYIRSEALSNSEVANLNTRLITFFGDMGMAIPT